MGLCYVGGRGVAFIKKGTFPTYRGDRSTFIYKNQKKIMARKKSPQWSFWKVVFAGWLIRYPGKISRVFFCALGFLIIVIYKVATT